jgi:hypothetical protein
MESSLQWYLYTTNRLNGKETYTCLLNELSAPQLGRIESQRNTDFTGCNNIYWDSKFLEDGKNLHHFSIWEFYSAKTWSNKSHRQISFQKYLPLQEIHIVQASSYSQYPTMWHSVWPRCLSKMSVPHVNYPLNKKLDQNFSVKENTTYMLKYSL